MIAGPPGTRRKVAPCRVRGLFPLKSPEPPGGRGSQEHGEGKVSPFFRPRDPQYAGGVETPPDLDRRLESTRRGIHVIGAAAGAPLLKIALNQGVEAVRAIARIMPPAGGEDPLDLAIIGAGPAGISAALEARKKGYSFVILEQGRVLDTLCAYPGGKKVYAEPSTLKTLGGLWFDDSAKEELLERWGDAAADLPVRLGAEVTDILGSEGDFRVETKGGETFRARRVILALGRMGNPRKLGVPGEDLPCVYSHLLNPGKYEGKKILVVGGGNSAVEAALALAGSNQVTLVHRGVDFPRVFKDLRRKLEEKEREGKVRILRPARVLSFGPEKAEIEAGGRRETLAMDAAFVLIGTDPPLAFFKRAGIALEGAWTWWRALTLAWVFFLVYALYGIKAGLWPFRGVYAALLSARLDPSFLYGILYTVLVTTFGARALWKYRDDPYQRKRFSTLMAAQWLVYFLLPWGLFYLGYPEWWRSWGVTLTYPLGYYALWEPASSLFAGSALPWALGSLAAFLVVMPLVSAFFGKAFCAWVCPCGALAETVGDEWRRKAPRGKGALKVEVSSTVILLLTLAASFYIVLDYRLSLEPDTVKKVYKAAVDLGLASILAITLYPFKGGRIWCRFFCPLARWMELWGRWTGGRRAIVPNDECISCGECTRYCQMGIDVRAFAQRGEPLSNESTSCVFCGICVNKCPVDVLRVGRLPKEKGKGRA